MKLRNFWQGLLFTAFLLSGLAAHAGLILTLDDGTDSVTVEDLDGDGLVQWLGAIGSWNINATTGLSNPAIGSEHVDEMHLNSLNVSGGAGMLTVTLTRTGLDSSPANWVTSIGGVAASGGSIYFETLLNGIAISSFSALPGAFSYTGSGQTNELEPYSLSLVATITHDGARDASSFDYVVKVPAPSTLALLGSGLLLTGWMGTRRRQKV